MTLNCMWQKQNGEKPILMYAPHFIYVLHCLFLSGVLSAIKHVIAKEGPTGLYRGNGAQMVRVFPYAAIQFGTFEYCKKVNMVKMNYNLIKLFETLIEKLLFYQELRLDLLTLFQHVPSLLNISNQVLTSLLSGTVAGINFKL